MASQKGDWVLHSELEYNISLARFTKGDFDGGQVTFKWFTNSGGRV
jgi:hypothetical protein